MLRQLQFSNLTLIFLLSICMGGVAYAAPPETAVVISAETPVYSAPSLDAKVVTRLSRGSELAITASGDGFVGIELSSDQEGWLPEGKVGLKVNRNGQVCVEVGLEEAISEGLIDAHFQGSGEHYGNSITARASVKVELGATICPKVRKPFLLAPARSGQGPNNYQRMMVRSIRGMWKAGNPFNPMDFWELGIEPEAGFSLDGEVALGGDESSSGVLLLEAYCLDPSKSTPSPGLTMVADFEETVPNIDTSEEMTDLDFLYAVWEARD